MGLDSKNGGEVGANNSLQSICYKKGSLRLLDQRKLPPFGICLPGHQGCNRWMGSRLTAYELVHEKIPSTLIADSAAAALMTFGRVNAVVVGADRRCVWHPCLEPHF